MNTNFWHVYLFLLLMLPFLFDGCSKKTAPPAAQDVGVCLDKQSLYISNGSVTYKSASRNLSANIECYVDRNDRAFFQASILFIEGARGLITQDSFFIINRLDRTYMALRPRSSFCFPEITAPATSGSLSAKTPKV